MRSQVAASKTCCTEHLGKIQYSNSIRHARQRRHGFRNLLNLKRKAQAMMSLAFHRHFIPPFFVTVIHQAEPQTLTRTSLKTETIFIKPNFEKSQYLPAPVDHSVAFHPPRERFRNFAPLPRPREDLDWIPTANQKRAQGGGVRDVDEENDV